MHKITAGTVKSTFKKLIERFVAKDNAFSFIISVKGALAYWRKFLHDVLAMVNN